LWYFNPPNVKRTVYAELYNPLNQTQMTKPWANYPSTDTFLQNPCSSGGFESNPAYNPSTQYVYVAAFNCPSWTKIIPLKGAGIQYSGGGSSPTANGTTQADNTTIFALNAATGKIAWSYFIPNIGYRGGVTTTSDLVIVPRQDGKIDFLNAQTGKLLFEKFIGGALITEPAVATDSNNNMVIVMPASNSAASSGTVIAAGINANAPGFMFALAPTSSTGNQTTVSLTNVTSNSTAATRGITTTASGTSSQVATTGVSSSVFYGVVALAVIFAVSTAAIAMYAFRRKPR
jgi:hypothetical protein